MNSLSGVVVIDKSEGVTSHDVVAHIRWLTKARHVGHFGTLDPLATGVLPVAVGRATRLQQFYLSSTKIYTGKIRFGYATTTYDREGEAITKPMHVSLSQEDLDEVKLRFLGTSMQIPPAFSAKKIGGVSAHRLARRKQTVQLAPQQIQIYRLELRLAASDEADFELECSGGTYVRSLAHDIGNEIGCGAHLWELRRCASGEFTLHESIQFLLLAGKSDAPRKREALDQAWIPLGRLLPSLPRIELSEEEIRRVRFGLPLEARKQNLEQREDYHSLEFQGRRVRLMSPSGELIGIGLVETTSPQDAVLLVKPKVVLVE